MGDAILKWANRVCRGHDHIRPPDDFEESWADGMCFCALYYAYFPDKIPIKTLTANTDEEKINNLALAFKVGEEAGVDPLLDPDDTLHVCEKKSIMLYLSEACGVLKEYPIKFSASAEWIKKYEAEEKIRKFAEWKLQKEAESRGEIWNPPKSVRGGSVLNTPKPSAEESKPVSTPATPASTTRSIGKKWDPKGLANEEEKTPMKTPEPKTTQTEPVKPVSTPVTKTEPKPVVTPAKTVEPAKPVAKPTPVVSKTVEPPKPVSSTPVASTPVASTPIKKWEPKTEEKPEPSPVTSPTTITKTVSKRWDPKANQANNEDKEEKNPPAEPSTPTSSGEAGLSYEIGRGKEGGGENRMHIFSVQFKIDGRLVINPKKDDIGVFCECPGAEPRFTIMISNNAYHIGFTPSAGGQHWFDFTYKGTWTTEPFCLPIKDKFNKVPDHPYTGAAKQKT